MNGDRRFIDASNVLFDILLFEDRPATILEQLAKIMGETLGVDRSLIYDISFTADHADALVEWLNPLVPSLPPTKGTYPLDVFRAAANHVRATHASVTSYSDDRNPILVSDGSAQLLHETMQVQALLWCPFSFREDGFYVLVFNAVAQPRKFSADEIELVQAATRHVGMALLKIELIRQRARAEEELLAAQKLESLGVLAGGIAHDFNNLMVGVISNTELAARRLPKDSPIRALILDAEAAGQRAAQLASELLAYAGKGPPGVARVDVGEVVSRTARLVHASMPQIKQDLRMLGDLPSIECNLSQLEQVVMNLLINAAEAMHERLDQVVRVRVGSVIIDADAAAAYGPVRPAPGEYVAISVADDGVGMAPETIAKIFDPFFTTKPTGRGLGLSAVLGVVKRHHGAIRIESVLGSGTTFTVLWPAAGEHVPETVVPPVAPLRAGGAHTVLVVDDVPEVARAIELVLTELGFESKIAVGGHDGLALFREHATTIDCALVDLTMPTPAGVDVLRALRAMRPELPIVLMSGYSEADATQLLDARTAFVKKPFLAAELDTALRRVLAAPSVRDD